MILDQRTLDRLGSQISRGEIVLFTGAGFSVAARNRQGESVPSTDELRGLLWRVCFPETEVDDSSSLGDLFEFARAHRSREIGELLERRFSIDPAALPEFYGHYFNTPWQRCYTLNIDDIALAAGRGLDLVRPVTVISATRPSSELRMPGAGADTLEVVHLNGVIPGPPEYLTFSETQYAQRISNQEPWYAQCVAELMSRPVIFVGTELREPPLWQHMELRRRHGSQGRDLRPTSLLVTPSLNAPRQALLRDLRIEWFQGTAEEFAYEVLEKLRVEARKGFAFLESRTRLSGRVTIPLVSQVSAVRPTLETEYLIGAEPHWSDLLTGRAIQRLDDGSLYEQALGILRTEGKATALAVTGTAGTGKSTALMRLVLSLSSTGIPVLWVDRDSEASPALMRKQVHETDGPLALAIDDADVYGRQLINLIRDLVPNRDRFLFTFAMRANKLDQVSTSIGQSGEVELLEHAIPNLTDTDIDELIATLDRHNRLGVLKGAGPEERRRAFREQAGRQLLVAMIQATSGRRFEEKVHDELAGLDGDQRYVYSLVSLASSLRHYLCRDEVIVACGDRRLEGLEALDRLTGRHLLVAFPPAYRYRARHRVVANLVVEKLQSEGGLGDVVRGLAFAAGSKVSPAGPRSGRLWRLVATVLSHDYLLRVLGTMDARSVYEEVESLLNFDYHYWLQRGSLEVESGDVALAENFLNQARSIAPDNHKVDTEFAYMLMRRAYEQPGAPDAQETIEEAVQLLENVITSRGDDPYPYHVLGSQGLAWSRRANLGQSQRRRFLESIVAQVDHGSRAHPQESDLRQLLGDLRREILMTTVADSSGSA
ncbi:MAG TPA: SIR2 family protein [Thermoanaerobaculales bacterium]|nr:SIR2 family protein [Thermoanaerobaculales bacterium]HQP88978.1 SIR2 family protein [Thermoanaerobaculia bacterium]